MLKVSILHGNRLFLLSFMDHEAVDEITGDGDVIDVTNKDTISIENTIVKNSKGDMEKGSNSNSELNREKVIVDTDEKDKDSALVHLPSTHITRDAWDTNEHKHHKVIETYHTEGPA